MGVLGSAFNPPHLGHLVLAQEAAAQLGLDEVLLVPTGVAPHKEIADDPGADVRFEMAELAAGEAEGLSVSEVEVRRDGPSYAFETLEILRESHPGVELVWLMGADAALGLESWKRPERIVELARLGIAGREGVVRSDLDEVLARVGVDLDGDGVVEIEMPTIGISSSALRERVHSGRTIDRFVPAPVAELIAERGLYGG
ncbi:MAG: nicotinate-nucleotide adenylyltransferase [Solirubrobacterales bacterium]